jgi:Response regulator containing a CheY-like receiver domain and an HD-GYP domain
MPAFSLHERPVGSRARTEYGGGRRCSLSWYVLSRRRDPFRMRNAVETLNESLGGLHREVREHFPFVVRIAVALYDSQTGDVKTFLYSPGEVSPLTHYRVPLAEAGWLDELRRTRRARVIGRLDPSVLGGQPHSERILAAGYQSSYTVPMFDGEEFLGFVFFDADVPEAFSARVVRQLDLFVRIISLMIENALRSVSVLFGGLHLLREISAFRDVETASHLSRMSYYAERIARRIASGFGRDDAWVEYVRRFAPLHDIGKIAIPDSILLKPGKLTAAQFETMKGHAVKGEEILDALIRELSLDRMQHIDALRHIARHHHERWDGTGYPDGLEAGLIPVEARIVKIADVFDALTSKRCYKAAWPVEDAIAFLRKGAGTEFDPHLVKLFVEEPQAIGVIMGRFAEESSEAT